MPLGRRFPLEMCQELFTLSGRTRSVATRWRQRVRTARLRPPCSQKSRELPRLLRPRTPGQPGDRWLLQARRFPSVVLLIRAHVCPPKFTRVGFCYQRVLFPERKGALGLTLTRPTREERKHEWNARVHSRSHTPHTHATVHTRHTPHIHPTHAACSHYTHTTREKGNG